MILKDQLLHGFLHKEMIDKIYIIHYSKLKERRENIDSFLKDSGVPYEFITDYDQENLEYVKSNYYNLDQNEYYRKIDVYKNVNLRPKFRVLSDAEISCTIKHIIAIKKISDECENCGLILEDDAIPYNSNFIGEIEKTIIETPDNWGCIFLGNGIGNNFISNHKKNRITDTLYKAEHPATNCAEAYVINKNTAKIIYDTIIPFQQISDWELACNFYLNNLDIYWRIPSLLYQGSISGKFKSTLR